MSTIKIKVPREQLIKLQHDIVDHIKQLKNYGTLKFDTKLILDVCNIIENSKVIKKSKQKIDKKKVVIEIFDMVFNTLDPDAKNTIGDIIDFLHVDGKIKVESYLKWISKILIRILLNKIM